MLILGRKKGQAITIDGVVRVIVHEIRGSSVRLAIEAPDDVKIVREELLRLPKTDPDTSENE